jgi:hypothetical protein
MAAVLCRQTLLGTSSSLQTAGVGRRGWGQIAYGQILQHVHTLRSDMLRITLLPHIVMPFRGAGFGFRPTEETPSTICPPNLSQRRQQMCTYSMCKQNQLSHICTSYTVHRTPTTDHRPPTGAHGAARAGSRGQMNRWSGGRWGGGSAALPANKVIYLLSGGRPWTLLDVGYWSSSNTRVGRLLLRKVAAPKRNKLGS